MKNFYVFYGYVWKVILICCFCWWWLFFFLLSMFLRRELVILSTATILPIHFFKLQRLVVMTSGGQLSKDQRFGMVRIIIEKPKCYNARSSWGHRDIRQGPEQEKSPVSLVLEIPWEQFSCGISAFCHTKIKICRNASIFLFFPPLKYTKIIKTQS